MDFLTYWENRMLKNFLCFQLSNTLQKGEAEAARVSWADDYLENLTEPLLCAAIEVLTTCGKILSNL